MGIHVRRTGPRPLFGFRAAGRQSEVREAARHTTVCRYSCTDSAETPQWVPRCLAFSAPAFSNFRSGDLSFYTAHVLVFPRILRGHGPGHIPEGMVVLLGGTASWRDWSSEILVKSSKSMNFY